MTTSLAPVGRLWNTHDALCETLRETHRALVQTERVLRQYDHAQATSKEITSEHADRLEETYDGPVLDIALMLLEFNRRKWLHEKPDTNSADEVERHGLTATQRDRLNDLRDSWRAHDEVYDPRTIEQDELSSHLQTITTEGRNENWGNVRVNIEAALEAAEGLEEKRSQ